MKADLTSLVERFPILWHLTTSDNAELIRETKSLKSAAALMHESGDLQWLKRRRPVATALQLANRMVWLRDQAPLHEGAVRLEGGWDFGRLIEEINRRVFFWPGDAKGRVSAARESFDTFLTAPGVVAIQIPFRAMRQVCRPFQIEITSVNVGALRSNPVTGLPTRGPSTFVAPGAFGGPFSKIREMVVKDAVSLRSVWSEVTFR